MGDVLERARRLGHEVFASIAEQGEPGRVNRPLVKALGDEGLLELVFAGRAGDLCQLREGLAHGCTEAETALALQGLGGYPILEAAQPEDRALSRHRGVSIDELLDRPADRGGEVACLSDQGLVQPQLLHSLKSTGRGDGPEESDDDLGSSCRGRHRFRPG